MKRHYWHISASTPNGWITINSDAELKYISKSSLDDIRGLVAEKHKVEPSVVKIESISYLGHMTKEQWEN